MKKLAVVAQLVEHVLGKDEVIGSIPINGSVLTLGNPTLSVCFQQNYSGLTKTIFSRTVEKLCIYWILRAHGYGNDQRQHGQAQV